MCGLGIPRFESLGAVSNIVWSDDIFITSFVSSMASLFACFWFDWWTLFNVDVKLLSFKFVFVAVKILMLTSCVSGYLLNSI